MANIFDIFAEISAKKETANAPISHIIVGLGNPGDKYFNTRHNAGFLMMDYLAQRAGVKVDRVKFKALSGEATLGGKRVLLLKPQTLMNASGLSVKEAASFYKIAPENILVFSDDVSLDVGRSRMRLKGSDGGQKGLRSIITQMNTDEFPRIRFGVGSKPHPDYDMADWVLSEFNKDEQKLLFARFEPAFEGVLRYLAGDSEAAIRICNAKSEAST
ncbi:MAG: aminoacyl-tRNA hydrolase [Clostridia bacterium]|nr:aminoacyl-tRNA hydrolase [Clostridia bacterium]